MKNLIVFCTLLLFAANIFAQSNENKAKSEFFAAQEAYDYANYKECVNHLNTTEKLLGSTNPRILHLKIKAYCNLKEYSKAYETQKIFFEKATDPNDPKYNDIVKLLSEINKNAANDFVEVGKTYIDKKYYTQATKEFNKALEIDPKNISAHFNLGTAFLNTNEYDKALLSYSKARTLTSSIEDKNSRFGWLFPIAYNKGIAYENLGKYDLAIASYGNAIKVKPDKISPYYQLACIYAKQNNTTQSLKYLEKALKNGFSDFTSIEKEPYLTKIVTTDAYKELKTRIYDDRDGRMYKTVQIGNQFWMAENLNYKTESSCCYENNPANCDTYGRLYTWNDAKNACPDGWHLPSDAEWNTLITKFGGPKLARLKFHDSSIGFNTVGGGARYGNDSFTELLMSWFYTSNKGYVFVGPSFKTSTLNRVKRAHNSDGFSFSVRCIKEPTDYYELGLANIENGNYSKALESFKKVIETEQDNEVACWSYWFIGTIHYINKNYDMAIEAYTKAIKIDSKHVYSFCKIGKVYIMKKNYDKALEALNKAIEINPDYAKTYYIIGRMNYLYLNKVDASKYYFNKVTKLDEANSLNTIFSIYFLGKEEEAIRRMNLRIIDAKNTNDTQKIATEYYTFACLFSLGKKNESALRYLELALQNGYNDFKYLNFDSDLDNIRNDAKFKILIEKYRH